MENVCLDPELARMLNTQDVPQDVTEMADYLSRPEIVSQLLELMLQPFGEEEDRESRELFARADQIDDLPEWVKFAVKATEIVSMDIGSMFSVLFTDKSLLEKLFSFLDLDTINPWLALKITGCVHKLFLRYPVDMFAFVQDLQTRKPVVKRLVHHISSPPLCNLLCSLLTGAMSEDGQPFPVDSQDWWLQNHLITDIYDLVEHGNVDQIIASCRLLTDIVRRPHPFESKKMVPFIEALAEEGNLRRLVAVMVADEKRDGCSVLFQEGVGVLATVLGIEKVSMYKVDDGITNAAIRVVAESLGEFRRILQSPGPLNPASVTWQSAALPPLGPSRVKVMELLSHFAAARPSVTHPYLVASDTLPAFLSLCKQYDMNNIAHCHLHDTIDTAIPKSPDAEAYGVLLAHLLEDCKLPQFIIECNEENEKQLSQHNFSKGYMGHITVISEMLVTPWPAHPNVSLPAVGDAPGWKEYVECHLAPRLELERVSPWPQGGGEEECLGFRLPIEEVNTVDQSSNYITNNHQPDFDGFDGPVEDKYRVGDSAMSRYHASVANESQEGERNDQDISDILGDFTQEGFGNVLSEGKVDDSLLDGIEPAAEWDNVNSNQIEPAEGDAEEEHQIQDTRNILDELPDLLPSGGKDKPVETDTLEQHIRHTALASSPAPAAHPNLIHKLEEIHSHPLNTLSDNTADFNWSQAWMLPLEDLDQDLGDG